MEIQGKCQRCQIKSIVFACEKCRPYTLFCSQCDTFVHSLPFKMNHLRKQIGNSIITNRTFPLPKQSSLTERDRMLSWAANNNANELPIDSSNYLKEPRKIEIENKQLKRELLNLSHLKNQQDDIKDDLELFYETKLTQLNKDNIALKQLINESNESSCIITQLKAQIDQMNIRLKEQNTEIQARKEKYKDLEGFYKFKFEEMQKEKEFLINQIQRGAHKTLISEEENKKCSYKDFSYQLPIKDNNKAYN